LYEEAVDGSLVCQQWRKEAARRLSAMASRVGDKDNINSSNKLMQQSTGHLPKELLLLKESLSYPETYIIQIWYHVLYLETSS
jgi:hypothetical protein